MKKSIDSLMFAGKPLNEISVYGMPPVNGPVDGYSYAGLKMVQALNGLGISTPWRDDSSPISISFCQPDWYSQSESQFRIGYTPWESTRIPEWWVGHMNNVDIMWTTSSFCKRVFKECGVTNDIIVVPHGIDSNDYWAMPRRYERGERFYFLHIGEPATRKGGQLVVDAFVETFKDFDDVFLIMKANGWCEARLREPFGPVDNHPRIKLIKDRFTIADMESLYMRAHALIYPSNGEGFGLIPFQGIATGLPVAAVVWGGIEEFGEHCIPINYSVQDSGHDYHMGDWAVPDFDSICETMMKIYMDYEKISTWAYAQAEVIHKNWQWEDIILRGLEESFL